MASAPITIEQRITAASQFTGAAPTTAFTDDVDQGIRTFPTDTVGGLFTFALSALWWQEVERIVVQFADSATADISIVNAAGNALSIYTAALGGEVVITDKFELAPDEKIRIVTTGATLAMWARVTMRPLVSRPQ